MISKLSFLMFYCGYACGRVVTAPVPEEGRAKFKATEGKP